MHLSAPMCIVKNPSYFYRIWGYWKSPGMLRTLGLWSDRQDQRLRTMLMTQRGKGKSRSDSIYEKLSKPKYRVKWVRSEEDTK